ncbi:hypothetical protein [Chryseobacterium sp. G0201]|uniref:hypothetical protein n=1 Tax=Chryseobacterium sp. G0201 TaxID=2487065 RepID=UPI000F4DE6DC|nr:hypothetical protein [Chryseobacterium sp. G0201]AZA52498.1 hypothetical protein EG348_05525 [Chryseobacterium sp. G0201]
MKKIFTYYIFLLFLYSCNKDTLIKNNLEKTSSDYFTKHKIDTTEFKSIYYIRSKSNDTVLHKHYVLKYYRLINKDSVIIWFSRDDEAEYFIDINDEFYKYYIHNKNGWE